MRARGGIADAIDWRLYFVTDTALCGGPDRVPTVVEAAVRGGAGVVQVRDKHATDAEFLSLARACVAAVRRVEDATGRTAAVVVNDRLDAARELGLHLHLGQSDIAAARARPLLGDDLLIGLSISSDSELNRELADPSADVVGLSPLYSTPTKPDAAAPLGPGGVTRLAARAHPLPSVAIGGISIGNIAGVAATGVAGACVVSALASARDPEMTAQLLLTAFDSGIRAASEPTDPRESR